MALQKQLVGIKAGVLDTINASIHVPAGDFITIDNATRDKGGEWRKRQGLTSLATSFSGYERLASVGADLCAYRSTGAFASLGTNGLVTQTLPAPGFLYSPTVTRFAPGSETRRGCTSGGLGGTFVSAAWAAAGGSYTQRIAEEVTTTGQQLDFAARIADLVGYTSTLNVVTARMVVTTNWIVYIHSDSAAGLVAWNYNRTTRAVSVTGSVLYADCVTGRFDLIASTSKTDRVVLAYARDAGAGLRVVELNAANMAVTLGPTADATNVVALGLSRGHNEADGFYWLATADVTNGVRKKTFTTAALTAAGAWTAVDAAKLAVTNVALFGAGTRCAFDNTASSITSVYQDTRLIAKHAYLASQYLEDNAFIILNPNSVDPAYYVAAAGTNFYAYVKARILGGVAPTTAVQQCALPDFCSPASGQFVGALLYQSALGFLSCARVELDRRALSSVRYGVAVPSGTDLFVPLGPLQQYDGARYAEAGPMTAPRAPALSAGTAGALTASGSYTYYLVLCRVDAAGKLWRSPPSAPTSVTVGATTPSVTVTDDCSWQTYSTRNTDAFGDNGLTSEYYVEIYRVNPGTTTPRLVTRKRQAVFLVDRSYVDGATDATVLAGEALYTESQVKENVFPPAFYSLCQWQNRLVGVSFEDRCKIWYSKEFVSGLGVGWNSVFTLETLDEYGPYYAVASMDDKLILFKENAIYLLTGQGPDSTGANAFVSATRIATNVGTRNPSSVVRIPDGIMFQGTRGIYLIDRALQVKFLGAPLSGGATTGISNPVTAAVAVPDRNEVRFTFAASPGTVVYNWFFECWSTWMASVAVSAVLRNGIYYMLTAGGACKYEDSATFADDGAAVQFSFKTGWMSIAGLQGHVRLYAARLFGERPSGASNHTILIDLEYDGLTTGPGAQNFVTPTISTDAEYQWEALPARQKCSSLRMTIRDVASTAALETFKLRGIALLIGVKPGFVNRNPNTAAAY